MYVNPTTAGISPVEISIADSTMKELVDRIHSRGILVNVWTCDQPERAHKLVDWGVDFITSNILE